MADASGTVAHGGGRAVQRRTERVLGGARGAVGQHSSCWHSSPLRALRRTPPPRSRTLPRSARAVRSFPSSATTTPTPTRTSHCCCRRGRCRRTSATADAAMASSRGEPTPGRRASCRATAAAAAQPTARSPTRVCRRGAGIGCVAFASRVTYLGCSASCPGAPGTMSLHRAAHPDFVFRRRTRAAGSLVAAAADRSDNAGQPARRHPRPAGKRAR
jgi:hypothetical protein